MDRIKCDLDKLGAQITNTLRYTRIAKLPFSLLGIITSGYFGNIYAATKTKGKSKIGIQVSHNLRRMFVVKLMHDVKYNVRDANRMIKANLLVRSRICPHFPIVYGQFHIHNVDFLGISGKGVALSQNINQLISKGPAVGVMMEDLGHLTLENYVFWKPETEELRQILFQCYVGIYAIIKHLHMNHGDFHFKNVMLVELSHPTTFTYSINNQLFKVVAKQFFPVIIDINGNKHGKRINQMSDIKHINTFMKRFVPIHFHKLDLFLDTSSINVFFRKNFHQFKYTSDNTSNKLIDHNSPFVL